MKKLFALLLAALLLFAVPAQAEGGPTMEVVNCKKSVTLRESPDTKSPALRKVPLGSWVTECEPADDRFTYCCFDYERGYILTEYLREVGEPPAPREAAVLKAGTEEAVTETCYHSFMGIAVWYDAGAFSLLDSMSESSTPSFVLIDRAGQADLVAMAEFYSPAITGRKGDAFFTRYAKKYGVKIRSRDKGVTAAGDAWRMAAGLKENREVSFWSVTHGKKEIQLVITLSLELTESYQPLLRRIVDQLRFDGQ